MDIEEQIAFVSDTVEKRAFEKKYCIPVGKTLVQNSVTTEIGYIETMYAYVEYGDLRICSYACFVSLTTNKITTVPMENLLRITIKDVAHRLYQKEE